MVKTLNLDKCKFGKNLQDNLVQIHKKYGLTFNISHKEWVVPVNFTIVKMYKFSYYRLMYDIPGEYTEHLPFVIDFYDIDTKEKSNNSYTHYIRKAPSISGSNIIKIVLKLQEVIGVSRTTLHDKAKIYCDKTNNYMDLSMHSLMKYGKTFYTKFGFKLYTNKNLLSTSRPLELTMSDIHTNLEKFKQIEIKPLIEIQKQIIDMMADAIKNNETNKIVRIDYQYGYSGEKYVTRKNTSSNTNAINTLYEASKVLAILQSTKEKYLYKLLIYLFTNNCQNFIILNDMLLNAPIEISYKRKKIKLPLVKHISIILFLKSNNSYEYIF